MADARSELQNVMLPGASVRAPKRYDVVRETDERTVLQPPPPASGVVWISVITAQPAEGASGSMGDIVRAQAQERGKKPRELDDGRVVVAFDDLAEEQGQRLLVRTCQIGIEKTLGILQVVIPEADVNEPANRTLLTDLAAMAETFQPAERTEVVETPTGAVETTVSTIHPQGETRRRDFGPDEQREVEEFLAFADGLVGRYAAFTKDITPKLLDTVFNRWMQDADREKADGERVSLAIGTAFGECVRKKLGMRWAVISDDQGEAWALVHDSTTLMAFPIESVRKRVEDHETNFLHSLSQVLESHFKEGVGRTGEGQP